MLYKRNISVKFKVKKYIPLLAKTLKTKAL